MPPTKKVVKFIKINNVLMWHIIRLTSIYFQIPDIFNSNLFENNEIDHVLKVLRNINPSNCICLKSKNPLNCLSSSSFLNYFSGITANSEQRHSLWTNRQLIQFSQNVAIKGNISGLFIFWIRLTNSPETNLINVATCLFADH